MKYGDDDIRRLRGRIDHWIERLGLEPRVVRIQQMTKKWGSCSAAGTITFATDLCACPPAFRDVVIVHELLHLRIRDHGRLFRARMTAYVPQWRRYLRDEKAESDRQSGAA